MLTGLNKSRTLLIAKPKVAQIAYKSFAYYSIDVFFKNRLGFVKDEPEWVGRGVDCFDTAEGKEMV